jgi:retron-type reverse transcriptase
MDPLLADLFKAYYDARRNKRNTPSALRFETRYESNLLKLYQEIRDRSYELQPSICFIVNEPVKREVFAADFRDRVVHHLIYNYIWPVFDRQFIYDSYSCRPGKGTLFGIRRLEHFIRSCSQNYRMDCYILKMDIRGYFMSMDRALLFEMVMTGLVNSRFVENLDLDLLQYLIRKTIFNDPTDGCIIRGHRSDWEGLPPTKSLFTALAGKGLPIGNLTSQLFSNIYLNELDQFVKRELKIKYYGRYVDDFFLIHPDREYLKNCIIWIREMLSDKLRLELHPKKMYLQHYAKGVKFLGVLIMPWRTYPDRRVVNRLKAVLLEYFDATNSRDLFRYQCRVMSYIGLLRQHNTKTLLSRINQGLVDPSTNPG